MLPTLRLEDNIAIMQLNRPDALNALNNEVISRISVLIDEVSESPAKALLILGSGGKSFCAGADIKEIKGLNLKAKRGKSKKGQSTFSKIRKLTIPTIACIDGYAFGGGLEMALFCDFRIATAKSTLGLPEIKLGLIPGYGGTQLLPRLIGESRALEMIMSGRAVKAEEAQRMGLVNRITSENILEDGMIFANEFTCYSPIALSYAKSSVVRGHAVELEEGLHIEADISTLAFNSEDAKEGITAFIEKRPAAFTGL